LTRDLTSNSCSEATTSWIQKSLQPSSQSTTVRTFYITAVRRLSLRFQSRDRSHKPLLALPSSVPFQVSLVRQISRYPMFIPLDTVGKDYLYRDAFDLVSTVIAPCGAQTVLNIKSDLRVDNSANRGGSGYMATDSVRSIYYIYVFTLNFRFSRRSTPRLSRYAILSYFFNATF